MLGRAELIDDAGAVVRSLAGRDPRTLGAGGTAARRRPGGRSAPTPRAGPAGGSPTRADTSPAWRRTDGPVEAADDRPSRRGSRRPAAVARAQLPAPSAYPPSTRGIEVRDDLLMLLDDGGQVCWRSARCSMRSGQAPRSTGCVRSGPIGRACDPGSTCSTPTRCSGFGGPPWREATRSTHPGNVLVSLRHQNCIAVLNWDDGRLVWAWGAGPVARPARRPGAGQRGHPRLRQRHGPGLVPRARDRPAGGEHRLGVPRAGSRPDFYTLSKGSNQRLPNGNTLVANSDQRRSVRGHRGRAKSSGSIATPHIDDRGSRAAIVRVTRHGSRVRRAAFGSRRIDSWLADQDQVLLDRAADLDLAVRLDEDVDLGAHRHLRPSR